MLKIDPDTTIEQVQSGIGKDARERKRESERRRSRLEKLARWTSGMKVKVYFQQRGAKCCPVPDEASSDMEIYLPTAEHEQYVTDLDPAVWDWVFQKAELTHELGHVLYTDFGAMEEYVEKIDGGVNKKLFQNLFNIVEDGAIERQLAAEHNVGNDLRIKNANLMRSVEPGRPWGATEAAGRKLTFSEAVECILLDWAKYDTGRASKLLDGGNTEYTFDDPDDRDRVTELLPTLEEMAERVVSEPNGRRRVEFVYEYFEELRDEFEGDQMYDPLNHIMQAFPDDAAVHFVAPGDPDDAEALEPDDDDVFIFLGDPENDDEEDTPDEEEVTQQYGELVDADDEGDDADEVEKWIEPVADADESLRYVEDGTVDSETWIRAKRYGKKYKSELRRVLQAERASSRRPNQRAGRPDPQSLWKLGYGHSRVFTDERRPEQKDYSVVVILDRSGSMGGDRRAPWIVDEAEATATGLTWALEELGAEVAVLSVGGDVALEKPFGIPVDRRKDVLCRNASNGNTPLGASLNLVLERLKRRPGNSLVFAVTDGEPGDEDVYEEALETATVPICGVYFGKSEPDGDDVRQYYHRFGTSDKAGLSGEIQRLIKRMVV